MDGGSQLYHLNHNIGHLHGHLSLSWILHNISSTIPSQGPTYLVEVRPTFASNCTMPPKCPTNLVEGRPNLVSYLVFILLISYPGATLELTHHRVHRSGHDTTVRRPHYTYLIVDPVDTPAFPHGRNRTSGHGTTTVRRTQHLTQTVIRSSPLIASS